MASEDQPVPVPASIPLTPAGQQQAQGQPQQRQQQQQPPPQHPSHQPPSQQESLRPYEPPQSTDDGPKQQEPRQQQQLRQWQQQMQRQAQQLEQQLLPYYQAGARASSALFRRAKEHQQRLSQQAQQHWQQALQQVPFWRQWAHQTAALAMQQILEESSIIAVAIMAVVALTVTRSMWFPSSLVLSFLPPPPSCHLSVALAEDGVWDGPWLSQAWHDAMSSGSVRGAWEGSSTGITAGSSSSSSSSTSTGKSLDVDGDDDLYEDRFGGIRPWSVAALCKAGKLVRGCRLSDSSSASVTPSEIGVGDDEGFSNSTARRRLMSASNSSSTTSGISGSSSSTGNWTDAEADEAWRWWEQQQEGAVEAGLPAALLAGRGNGDGGYGGEGGSDRGDTAALTHAFARLAERYLAPWLPIPGITEGIGRHGLVKNESLFSMATNKKLAPCVAHVRVVGGAVYFRYGSFLESHKLMRRLHLTLRMIEDALVLPGMQELKAELYLNVCDAPQSYDNSLSAGRSGFAVFSTQITPGTTDILCPDPLDLNHLSSPDAPSSPPRQPPQVAWSKRAAKAVWRSDDGAQFDLKRTNWATSLGVRLHRMSTARPDLLDAKITMWGPKDRDDAKRLLVREGFVLGRTLTRKQQRDWFKYAMVVDERVGTRQMCSTLASPRAVIRHASAFSQFFEPLLLPGIHYIPVKHSLSDLYSTVEWMQANDATVRQIIANANALADRLCTWRAYVRFWAVLLSKYAARAMEDPSAVASPPVCPGEGPLDEAAAWVKADTKPTCHLPNNATCSDFCVVDGNGGPDTWTWLQAKFRPVVSVSASEGGGNGGA